MSDIAEMAQELERALELGDYAAAERIGVELIAEAAQYGLEALACDLEVVLRRRHIAGALPIAAAMGLRAAELDRARDDFLGHHFHQGHDLADSAMDEAGIR